MIIIWGRKVVHAKLGRMARYCAICRDVKPFKVMAVESVGHLYYIPLGSRQTHGHYRTCPGCKLQQNLPEDELDGVVSSRDLSLEEMIPRNRPDIARGIYTRLDWDGAARSGTLDPAVRGDLILEPFGLMEGLLKPRAAHFQFDTWSTLTAVSVLAVPLLLCGFFPSLRPNDDGGFLTLGIIAGLFAVLTLYLVFTDARRFARAKLLPKLARSLAPLRPSAQEIEQALQATAAMGGKLHRHLDTERIERAIQAAEPHVDWS